MEYIGSILGFQFWLFFPNSSFPPTETLEAVVRAQETGFLATHRRPELNSELLAFGLSPFPDVVAILECAIK